jgi:hypothetical protein
MFLDKGLDLRKLCKTYDAKTTFSTFSGSNENVWKPIKFTTRAIFLIFFFSVDRF